jgi:large subunit ribosomal protein L21
MFAIVRTGGKQYRVAAGDKIVVDRMDGEAGSRITLGDVLFTSTGESGLTVAAEIIAQAKADKVIVFKKKRRHNYRRKNGHRQQHTILQIVSVGAAPVAEKKAKKEAAPVEADAAPAVDAATPGEAAAPVAAPKKKAAAKPAAETSAE